MSKKDRTIAYYSVFLVEKATDDMYEGESVAQVVNNILNYINNIGSLNLRKLEKKSDNKVYYLESLDQDIDNENIKYISFVSAKYNHVPELIDTDTLTEKSSNKTNKDGDKEYTNVGLLLKDDEVIMIHEQRVNGTPKSIVFEYLRKYFLKYLADQNVNVEYALAIEIIPNKAFVEELREMKRINMATIVIAKNDVGVTGFRRFAGRNEVQENVQLTFKSEAKKTIDKNDVLDAYNNRSNENIRRMIIHGFNENGRVRLDTEPIKTIERISVQLNDNGIVKKDSIQEEFKKILEGMM